MKKTLILTCLILLQTLLADDNNTFLSKLYFGTSLNVNMLQAEKESASGLIGGGAKVGYNFNHKYAIELTHNTSLFDEKSLRLDSSFSLNGKLMYDFENFYRDTLDIYFLGGVSTNTLSTKQRDETVTKISPSLGVGVDYKLSQSSSFYVDYTFLSPEVSQINLGISYSFKEEVIDFKADQIQQQKLKERLDEEKEQKLKNKVESEENNQTNIILRFLHKEDTQKPIFLYVFELASIDEFKRLDYSESTILTKGMLEGNVLGNTKLLLKPSTLRTFKLTPKHETRFIAVISTINDIESTDNWRFIKKIELEKLNVVNLMFDHEKIMEFK